MPYLQEVRALFGCSLSGSGEKECVVGGVKVGRREKESQRGKGLNRGRRG